MKTRLGALVALVVVLLLPACATASPSPASPRPSAVAATASTVATTSTGASVAPLRKDPTVVALATALLTPFSLALGDNGAIWFSQNFLGQLEVLPAGQAAQKVYKANGNLEVGAVSYSGGSTWFAVSGRAETLGKLFVVKGQGKPHLVANLAAYEAAKNPDAKARYGFRHLSASCAAQLPGGTTAVHGGVVETHPFATLRQGNHTLVADAAGNDILSVKDNGKVRTVAVLPPVHTTMTKAYAKQQKLPKCTVGKAYMAEPVPTDIEAGPGGTLYVTTLGGGPAGEGAESAGGVWRIDAKRHHASRIVGGLTTPTGLAVTPNGDLYVCELFGNQIVRIPAGSHLASTFYKVPLPGDVESTPNGLIATTNVLSGSSGKAGDPANADIVRLN